MVVPDEFLKAWQEAVSTNSKSAKGQLFQLWCAAGGQWGKNLGYVDTAFLQPKTMNSKVVSWSFGLFKNPRMKISHTRSREDRNEGKKRYGQNPNLTYSSIQGTSYRLYRCHFMNK